VNHVEDPSERDKRDLETNAAVVLPQQVNYLRVSVKVKQSRAEGYDGSMYGTPSVLGLRCDLQRQRVGVVFNISSSRIRFGCKFYANSDWAFSRRCILV
jgi:hypothetical protein